MEKSRLLLNYKNVKNKCQSEKYTSCFFKFKESGKTRGEIWKKREKEKGKKGKRAGKTCILGQWRGKERKKNINYVTILNWNRSKKGNRENSCANWRCFFRNGSKKIVTLWLRGVVLQNTAGRNNVNRSFTKNSIDRV